MVYYYKLGETLLKVEDDRTAHICNVIKRSHFARDITELVAVKVADQDDETTEQRKIHKDKNGEYFYWKNQKVYRDSYIKHHLQVSLLWVRELYQKDRSRVSLEEIESDYSRLIESIIFEGIQKVEGISLTGKWRIHPESIIRYDGEKIILEKTDGYIPEPIVLNKMQFMDKLSDGRLKLQRKDGPLTFRDYTAEFWATAREGISLWQKKLKDNSASENELTKILSQVYKMDKW